MVNYYIYAKDYSGSTRDESFYHENGLKTLEDFKRDVAKMEEELLKAGEESTSSNIVYLHWGDNCYEVDEDVTKLAYELQESGDMGTEPETIIDWIQKNITYDDNNKIKLLYILTDGLIYTKSAETCFQIYMYYETVVFHAFNKYLDEIDLSVAASFLKGRCKIYRNYELMDDTDISKKFNYENVNTDNFAIEKENLKSYIKLRYIKSFKNDFEALAEVEKLKNLRKRLFNELSSKSQKSESKLDTKDKDTFMCAFKNLDWYKNLNTPINNQRVDIEKSISTLINYIISDSKSYSFDAIKFESKFDTSVEEESLTDINFAPEEEIIFPDVILDDDKGIPVILLCEISLLDKIIFHTTPNKSDLGLPASFNKFKTTMDCPLFLINDSDISESIGYFYSLNVYKQLLSSDNKTEPRTRRPFNGGLVLTESDDFDKYNDYVLSATYFDSKKVDFNKGLFYYLIWKNCENKQWMDRNVLEQLKKYVMRRISSTKCKIGLSSLPLDPHETTSLTTALWYCVELSSCLFKDDPNHYMHERLRMYHGVANHMIDILKYFNYNLDLDTINNRKDLIQHVNILKRIPNYEEKVYFLLKNIFKTVNGFLVSEIENPSNISKLNYLKFNHKGMLRDDGLKKKIFLNNYVNFMYVQFRNENRTVKICDKTFRPYFTLDERKSFYTGVLEDYKKVVVHDDEENLKLEYVDIDSLEFDKILSCYNLYINCVKDKNKYPSLSEYLEYIAEKKRYHGNLVRIFPPDVCECAERVYLQYESIATTVDVSKFIEVSKAYVKRSDRIKAERVVEFKDDKDVEAYIRRQELEVKLKNKAPNTPRT